MTSHKKIINLPAITNQIQPLSFEKLVQRYEKQPVLRGLVQLIPVGSAVEAIVLTRLQNIIEDRTRTFFDELSKGNIELNPELLDSEDFLHCYFATLKAALNTRRREKIRMFARLLKSSILPDSFLNTEEYEGYLEILDELSYNEILILSILEKYSYSSLRLGIEGYYTVYYWEKFYEEIERTLNIPRNEIDSLLTRLNRTGCYENEIHQDEGYPKKLGTLTPVYFRLRKFIENEDGKFA